MKISQDGAGTSVTFVAILAIAGFGTSARADLPPQVQARCGVHFSMHAGWLYGGWVTAVRNSMGGTGWDYLIKLGYLPFVVLTNATNTTITLDKGIQTDGGPVVEFDQPELSMRFKRGGGLLSGDITTRTVPLSEMYASAKGRSHFRMTLYAGTDANGVGSGLVVLGPGQSQIFVPYMSATWTSLDVLDWQNNKGANLVAVPGWQGPQCGFHADFLCGNTSLVTSGLNGALGSIGIIASQAANTWDVEIEPTFPAQPRPFKLYPADPWFWQTWPELNREIGAFPFRPFSGNLLPQTSGMLVNSNTPVRNWLVKPLVVAETGPATFSMVAAIPASADSDGDGMDDAWEANLFGTPQAEPNADLDQDGFSNRFEFIAGSHPRDGGSRPRQSVSRSGSQTTLRWSSVPGRSYVIEASDDMAVWAPVQTAAGAAAPATETECTLTVTLPWKFYRLQIHGPF